MSIANENINPCKTCSCYCWLSTEQCIVSLSELTTDCNIETNQINFANSDVGDLLGEKCFEELCAALKSAIEQKNQHNEANPNDKKGLYDFLPDKWIVVIENRHFKMWYANRVSHYWFEGSSITQLKAVGLITTNNEDKEFKNGFKHAEEAQRKRLSKNAETYASNARTKFLKTFWTDCNSKTYDCVENCGCDDNLESPGGSIGFTAL